MSNITFQCDLNDERPLSDYTEFHYKFQLDGKPLGYAKINYYWSKNELIWNKFEPLIVQDDLKFTGLGTKCHMLILQNLAQQKMISSKTKVSHIPKATKDLRKKHLARMGLEYTLTYTFDEYLSKSIAYAKSRNYI